MTHYMTHWSDSSFRSAAYFSSLANGEPLPVKRRLEPVVGNGLTVGNLDVLVQQHKSRENKIVTKQQIQTKWGKSTLQIHNYHIRQSI